MVKYVMNKGYAVIDREWKKGDDIQLDLPMPVKQVIANKALSVDSNKVALQRGPIMYCGEWKDNAGKVSNIFIPGNTKFKTTYESGLLNGVTVLKAEVLKTDSLYGKVSKAEFTAIPYYSWANRGKGEMQVWFPQNLNGKELTAK